MNWKIIPDSWAGPLLSLLRIVTALLFMAHGTQKYFGIPPSDGGPPPLFSVMGISGLFEIVFGVLILIGLMTRVSAFLMSGMMAIAYWMVHFPMSPYPSINHGEPAVLFCFIFLYIAAAGPGPWSVDASRAPAS